MAYGNTTSDGRIEVPCNGCTEGCRSNQGLIQHPYKAEQVNSWQFRIAGQRPTGDPVFGPRHASRNSTPLGRPGSEPALNNCLHIDCVVVKHDFGSRGHFMSYVDDLLHEVTHRGVAYYAASDQDAIARLRS